MRLLLKYPIAVSITLREGGEDWITALVLKRVVRTRRGREWLVVVIGSYGEGWLNSKAYCN